MPEVGGGYTFVDDVFQAFLALSGESQQQFTVFVKQAVPQQRELPNRIKFVVVPENPPPPSLGQRVLTKFRRDVLHRPVPYYLNPLDKAVQETGVDFMWFVSNAFEKVRIPYLYTVWDLQHRRQPWFPEVGNSKVWNIREAFFSDVLLHAAGIIIGNQTGQQEIMQFYGILADRIHLLPHPTPGFVLSAGPDVGKDVTAKYNLPGHYLFYPAQFWAHKNHVGLLHTLNMLRHRYQLDFSVVFTGSDQGNEEFIRQLAQELGLHEHVRFLGFVPREDLIGLYRHAFGLVYLTFFGPENLPPLEAFALGCPVVASKVAGAEEQFGDAALLVDPTDEEQAAQAIYSIYSDAELRETLIQKGKARALAWTSTNYVKAIFSILDNFARVRRCWPSSTPTRIDNG